MEQRIQRRAIRWNIQRQPRDWTHEEFDQRSLAAPEKIEFVRGIFVSDDQRRMVLGMLLENLGIDAAVKFGRIEDWEAAIGSRRAEERPGA